MVTQKRHLEFGIDPALSGNWSSGAFVDAKGRERRHESPGDIYPVHAHREQFIARRSQL
jgi:hypothetical protein